MAFLQPQSAREAPSLRDSMRKANLWLRRTGAVGGALAMLEREHPNDFHALLFCARLSLKSFLSEDSRRYLLKLAEKLRELKKAREQDNWTPGKQAELSRLDARLKKVNEALGHLKPHRLEKALDVLEDKVFREPLMPRVRAFFRNFLADFEYGMS